MGKKLYEETQEGGICFKSERKPWEVRVPNYVYDLWMPVLGVVDIGVYNVYCRLERENVVKAISLETIARACRIGKSRLYDTNKRLEKCGFIRVTPPEGWQRLAHYTTEITVLDPPQEVPAWAIKEYCQLKDGYQPLSPWLVQEDETQVEPAGVPDGTSGETGQDAVKEPEGTPKVVTLGLQPLGVELMDVEANFFIKNPKPPAPSAPDSGGADSADDAAIIDEIADDFLNKPAPEDLQRVTEAKQSEAGNWADPAQAGGANAFRDGPVDAFCEVLAGIPPLKLPPGLRKSWGDKLREIAKKCDASPEVMERAIRAIPEDQIGWKTFSSPYADNFEDNIIPLLLRDGQPRQKGANHGNAHQRDRGRIAQGAVQREIATEDEARAILGDRYGGP